MKKRTRKTWLYAATLVNVLGMAVVHAADAPPGIVGKNEWLFYQYEMTEANNAAAADVSIDLIQRLNKLFAANGVSMVVAMVPLKMRIYSEHLPSNVQINDFMAGDYERMRKALQLARVNVVDLNTAFLNSPKRNSDTPLFFRLDTHWTPTGAMLAAETIKATIEAAPNLKMALGSTPEVGFKIAMNNRKRNSRARDLVEQLPKDSPVLAMEQSVQFSVSRAQPAKEDLLGNVPIPGVALTGSSYSSDWTGFADALRYVLQRDILNVAVGADQGFWVGMETYLRDDSFQTKAPKLLIWEMPERDMRAPPDYKFREARYVSNNTEWLLRVSALVQASCKKSAVMTKLATTGLAANVANVSGADIVTGVTNDSDFIEIGFDRPIDKLDYLAARVTTAGSKTMTLEASGPGVTTRRFTLNVPGDDAAHAVKTPLPSNGAGFTKVRLYPGTGNRFAFQGLQICRQPDSLLR